MNSPSKIKTPKVIEFIYRKRLLLGVDMFENNYYYGYVDNKPISKGIAYNQHVKEHKNKVVETKQ